MATQTLELEPDAFWRMVTEENLKTDGPSAGYMWTGKRGRNGWETYKTRAQPIGWLYQARRVNTQNAGGGGALVTRFHIPSGVTAKLVSIYVKGTASAGSSLSCALYDEDGATAGYLSNAAAGANREAFLPSIGGTAGATSNIMNTTDMVFGPGQIFSAITTAALQTETLTVYVCLLLSAETTAIVWDTTGSAGTPALAASTISATNTLQAVYL